MARGPWATLSLGRCPCRGPAPQEREAPAPFSRVTHGRRPGQAGDAGPWEPGRLLPEGEGRLRPEESHRWPHTAAQWPRRPRKALPTGLPSGQQGNSPLPSGSSETHPGHKACVPQPGGVRGSQEGKSGYPEHGAGAPSLPARSSTVTFPFRAAGQPGGGTGRGRPSCSEGICVFSKLHCWAHPRGEIIHLVTSLLGPEDHGEGMGQGPREGSFPSSPGKAEFCTWRSRGFRGEWPGVP